MFKTLESVRQRYPGMALDERFHNRTRVFVKTGSEPSISSEAAGLRALSHTETIRIAQVVGSSSEALVIEAIESGRPSSGFFENFGAALALMHHTGSADRFGFEQDNFLGATPQPNPWTSTWVEFFAEFRLGFQLQLAREHGHGDSQLQRLGDKLIQRLHSIIGSTKERPALIHGDLWSGNWICDEAGQPALIDPAVYYADREAEFGMTTLFGGLPQEFYDAYNDAWPMQEGWEERVAIYRLYHVLNHLNLFGTSYLADCINILKRFV